MEKNKKQLMIKGTRILTIGLVANILGIGNSSIILAESVKSQQKAEIFQKDSEMTYDEWHKEWVKAGAEAINQIKHLSGLSSDQQEIFIVELDSLAPVYGNQALEAQTSAELIQLLVQGRQALQEVLNKAKQQESKELAIRTSTTPFLLRIDKVVLPVDPGGKTDPDIPGTTTTPIPEGTQFGILFAPTSFGFGTVSKDFSYGAPLEQGLVGGKDQYIGVGDTRQDSPGWALTASASELKNGASTMLGKITAGVSVSHVSYVEGKYQIDKSTPSGATAQRPTGAGEVSIPFGQSQSGVKVMTAPKGTGTGMWAADLSDVKLVSNDTSSLQAGTYSGTVTWNLSNAPV